MPTASANSSLVEIGTHNGVFHADEALACFMLKSLPEYSDASVVRTRDPTRLAKCTIVVDVGGVYDHSTKRYDHHQREFSHTMRTVTSLPFDTKLSSAGLIYAHYGRQVIKCIDPDIKEDDLEVIYSKIYEGLVEEFDGMDNGINPYDGQPRYKVTTTIGNRVARLKPNWNEESSPDEMDKRFVTAMDLVGSELCDRIVFFSKHWLPARDAVKSAVENRHKVHDSGRVMCLESGGLPWKEHMFSIEKELSIEGEILFTIFADENGKWRVQAVPPSSLAGFDMRLSLPSKWCGLRDQNLSDVSQIGGCIFVHAAGFIGGNETRVLKISAAMNRVSRKIVQLPTSHHRSGALAMAVKCCEMAGMV